MFRNRNEAGQILGEKLEKYKEEDLVIFALPRGGVILGNEIAKRLNSPLDLIITRKIGHPQEPEYAIAAIGENGDIVGNEEELKKVDKSWLEERINQEKEEAKRRRQVYLHGKETIPVEGKIAIIVDDGIATGLTMRAAILELKHRKPKKIIVAVPVLPKETAEIIKKEADKLVALEIPEDFAGAIGAYYEYFPQVSDEKVVEILRSSANSTWEVD